MENIEGFREGEEVDIQYTSGERVPQSAPPMEDLVKGLRDYALPLVGLPPVIRDRLFKKTTLSLSLSLCI